MGNAGWSLVSFCVLALFFVLSAIEHRLNNRSHFLLIITLIVIAIVVLPFRNFGLDFNNYKDFYNIAFLYKSEPGYGLLMHFFQSLGASFETFYFCIYIVTMGLFFYAFKGEGNSIKLWFVFLALYYFTYFDVTRAFIASALVLVSLRFFCDRKIIQSCLTLGIGVTFHYSLLLVVPFLFLLKIKITRVRLLILTLAALFFGTIMNRFLFFLFERAVFYDTSLNFLHDGLRYNYSAASNVVDYFNSVHEFLLHSTILQIPVLSLIFSFLLLSEKTDKSRFLSYLLNFNHFGIVCFAFFYSFGSIIMAARVNQLLSIGLALLIIHFCFQGSGNNRKRGINLRYLFISLLLFIIGLFPFAYIAKVHQPGAMLYYKNIF